MREGKNRRKMGTVSPAGALPSAHRTPTRVKSLASREQDTALSDV